MNPIFDPLYYIENKDKVYKKGGGGSIDTSGLESATNRAIDLQKQMYDTTREDVRPWYDMGVGTVGLLSDLLGVSGGSIKSRDTLYNNLKDQYTTTNTSTIGGYQGVLPESLRGVNLDLVRSKHSQAGLQNMPFTDIPVNEMTDESLINWMLDQRASLVKDPENGAMKEQMWRDWLTNFQDGGEYQRTKTETITDYDALNAAVDEALANQTMPDNYGELLERFDMDKFEADPSYQFRQDEANKALQRQMAAQGVTLGGGGYGEINPQAARALQELNQNLASQEYGNAYQRYTADQLNKFNMLMGAAGMGQGTTGIMAGAGQNYANYAGNAMQDLAGAQLNAQMASGGGGSMFSNLLGTMGGTLISGNTPWGNIFGGGGGGFNKPAGYGWSGGTFYGG